MRPTPTSKDIHSSRDQVVLRRLVARDPQAVRRRAQVRSVPARTTAVFVAPEGSASGLKLGVEDTIEAEKHLELEATPTQPEPTPTSPEPALPTPTLRPEPSDSGLPVWSLAVAGLAVIGGVVAWAWRRLKQRDQEV